jgi:aryl-alcohol dehydrogenase-like predicted oxidoreductase
MLALAAGRGVDTLDTAITYGRSELRLGNVGVHDFRVVSKLPLVPMGCGYIASWVRNEIANSLKRLNIPSLYGLLLHSPSQLFTDVGPQLFEGLQQLKSDGSIRKIGVSIYSPDELGDLLARFPIDIVQAPLNLIDRRLDKSGWIRRLKDQGIEIHSRSTFLQGLLLMPRVPNKFSRWDELWDRWQAWLETNHVTALQACLAYPLSLQEIDRVVVGADATAQLEQILDASSSITSIEYPDLSSEDELLINPFHWRNL